VRTSAGTAPITLVFHAKETVMLLAQISDLHIKRPGRLAYGYVDTAAFLSRCVAQLNALEPQPDAVLITGDLVDLGNAEEYDHLRALLAPLAMPYFLSIGNHDNRAALRQAFPHHEYLRQHDTFVQYVVTLGPLRLIVLDTQDPPNGGGRLCAERQQWLADVLAQDSTQPTMIAMHHPPFACGIEHMDKQALEPDDAHAFAALIDTHPEIERVVCGHVHRAIQVRFAGTIASICPSTAHQVTLDLRPRGPSAFVMEPPAFQLHLWEPSSGLVTHTAYVGDFGPSRPFYDEDNALID
jgi:Icc protein